MNLGRQRCPVNRTLRLGCHPWAASKLGPVMQTLEYPSSKMTTDAYHRLIERALVQYVERFGLTDLARQALCQPVPPSAGSFGKPGHLS
jgi:hypothetical protein